MTLWPEMQAPLSIRGRLILQLLAGAAVLALLLFLVARVYARDLAGSSRDDILGASVTTILDQISVRAGAVSVDIPYAAFSMLDTPADDRVFYRVAQDGATLTGYADLPAAAPRPDGGVAFATDRYRGVTVRLATGARALTVADRPLRITVTVAQTRESLRATLQRIGWTVAGLGLGFFALAAGLGILAARSATARLNQLAQAVARRGPEDLRPITGPAVAETAPLIAALNGLIRRLRLSVDRSEDLIAEAAHRVRTPLATVRMQAELTLQRVEKPENRTAVREMIEAIDESSRAAGQLLDHAMVSFRTEHILREAVALGPLLAQAVERVRPVADMRGVEISVTLPAADARVRGDAILIENALINLLDNALKYGPDEGIVRAVLTLEPPRACIAVIDEGRGFPETEIGSLASRFVRGANSGGIVGSGLGLTIVGEVARAHGGALRISNLPDGDGACATVCLPLV